MISGQTGIYESESSFGCLRGNRSSTEIAASGESADTIRSAVSQCLNGHGGLSAPGRDETTAVAQKQILYVMRAVVRIDDRTLRIVAHAAGAEQVHGELLFVNVVRPLLFCAGRVEKFERAGIESNSRV